MGARADLTIGPPPEPEVESTPAVDDVGLDVDDLGGLESAPHIDESIVRSLLKGLGGAVGYVAGDDDVPEHWRFTDGELDALVPPLTRIINRRPQLARAVARGDEATVALVLAGYAGRNVAAGRKAKEARGERDGEAGPAAAAGDADARRVVGRHGWDGGDGRGVHPAAAGGLG